MSIIKYGKFDILHAGSVSLYCNLHIYKLYANIIYIYIKPATRHWPECILAGFERQKDRRASCDDAVSCYLYEVSKAGE